MFKHQKHRVLGLGRAKSCVSCLSLERFELEGQHATRVSAQEWHSECYAFLQPQDQCYAFFRVAPVSSTALSVTRLHCGGAEGAGFAGRTGNTIHSFLSSNSFPWRHVRTTRRHLDVPLLPIICTTKARTSPWSSPLAAAPLHARLAGGARRPSSKERPSSKRGHPNPTPQQRTKPSNPGQLDP